jgi:hypothetical protein
MAPTVHIVLIILAVICFVLAALGVVSRINLVAAGLAFWSIATLF